MVKSQWIVGKSLFLLVRSLFVCPKKKNCLDPRAFPVLPHPANRTRQENCRPGSASYWALSAQPKWTWCRPPGLGEIHWMGRFTLWLCQNSYWKWWFSSWIFPLRMVMFHSYVKLPEGSFPSSREVSEWETRGVSWTLVYFKAMKEEHWNPVGDATATRL